MEWSNQSEKNKVASAFIISRLPKESAAKNIKYTVVGKEVSQRKKKENANMVEELSKSRFEGQRRFQRL